jgi:predicted dehydrogenase
MRRWFQKKKPGIFSEVQQHSQLPGINSNRRGKQKKELSIVVKDLKTYVLVGAGNRGLAMFAIPLVKDFPDRARLAALCDPNTSRVAAAADNLEVKVKTFTDFEEMMRVIDPDGVIVATRDDTHAEYVIKALRAGKRVFSEKPLCTTADQCRDILASAAESPGLCLVTHNKRYGPSTVAIQSVLRSGQIGDLLFIQYEETLDRCHGADYFRRWHRKMANSGGLSIHKASHHFDAINWWVGSSPILVNAQGGLRFYGKNGPFRSTRCSDCPHGEKCEFHVDFFKDDLYRKLYQEAEQQDGYFRDQCVFAEEIDIYDQMGVLIKYQNQVDVNYSLIAYSPYESERIVFEGTKGRLEYLARMSTGWMVDSKPLPGIEEMASQELKLYIPGKGVEEVKIEQKEGSHGGADPQLRADFFGRDWDAEMHEQMASVDAAVQAVLVGLAVNESIESGQAVEVQRLLQA